VTFSLAGFGYACAVVLAAVFLVSGAAKLAWPAVTRANFARLGLPRPAALAIVVPAGELVAAILLLAFPVAGGLWSLAMLAVFSAALARLLRRGVDQPCGCLGSPRDTTPLSWRSLVRNAALALLAVAALFAEPGLPTAPEIAVTAVVVAGGWAALVALRPPRPARVTSGTSPKWPGGFGG
jgi:hypothetical protein